MALKVRILLSPLKQVLELTIKKEVIMFFDQNPIIRHDNFRQMDLNMRNNHLHCNDFRFSSSIRNDPFQNQTFRCHRCGSYAGPSYTCWMNENKFNTFNDPIIKINDFKPFKF
jgi:hypothetical protein